MTTLEQPQTESNLQTLEAELALTRQEMEEFKRLSKEEQERQKEERLTKLFDLQARLDQAIQGAIQTGQLDEARKLKEQLLKEISDLERVLLIIDKVDIKEVQKANKQFFKETFKERWGDHTEKVAQAIEKEPVLTPPENIEWKKLKEEVDTTKFGEYTLNPEMRKYSAEDFERLAEEGKIKVVELSEFVGKPLAEVAEYIVKTYSDEYDIPGIEFWKWIIENPEKSPEDMKDGNYHFFYGSVLCGGDGHWHVPRAYWDGGEWYRNVLWLGSAWYSHYHLVLIEK